MKVQIGKTATIGIGILRGSLLESEQILLQCVTQDETALGTVCLINAFQNTLFI